MADKFSMDDYIDVAERIQDFKDTHPKGVLRRHGIPTVMVLEGVEPRDDSKRGVKAGDPVRTPFIVYTARAYPNPVEEPDNYGEGTAWEPWPGATNYTHDSELMNAETAAWGRAIIALGLVANRKIASRQEVRARAGEEAAAEGRAPTSADVAKAKPISKDQVAEIAKLYKASGWKDDSAEDPHATLRMQLLMVDAANEGEIPALIAKLTGAQATTLTTALKDGTKS